jgi:hippurate hydrolase
MTVFVGTARLLSKQKDRWSGTLVMIGQPAEEMGVGARAMLREGLFRRFPKPDYAVALHDSVSLPAGTIGLVEGYQMANVDTVTIKVYGVGGHGAYPHLAKDPIVLAARIILSLQMIVSRETNPIHPAVVTVGSIHGGTRPNIIPDVVELQLTLRSYADDVRAHTIEAIRRICRGEAIAAGFPDDLLPEVNVLEDQYTPAAYNDPALTRRVRQALTARFGAERVKTIDPRSSASPCACSGSAPSRRKNGRKACGREWPFRRFIRAGLLPCPNRRSKPASPPWRPWFWTSWGGTQVEMRRSEHARNLANRMRTAKFLL